MSLDASSSSKDFVNSLARGLAIIRTFDAEHQEMTLSEVAERADMTRAGARRFLLTLATLGYVIKDDRKFRLSPKILNLGYAFMASLPIAELAQPYLDEITRDTGESSSCLPALVPAPSPHRKARQARRS